MARVAGLERESLPADLLGLWDAFTCDGQDFTNQARVLARSPAAFRHLYGLIDDWRRSARLPRRLVEIAVVTTSRLNACPYCVGHHGATLTGLGLAAETVERILEPDVPGLEPRERLVRDYARLLVERPWGIRESVFRELHDEFSDEEIVELTVRIGLCSLFNTLNQALEIDMEEGTRLAVEQLGLDIGDDPHRGQADGDAAGNAA